MNTGKKRPSPEEILLKLAAATLSSEGALFHLQDEEAASGRLKALRYSVSILTKPIQMKPGNQLALIMYDIEDHKVRKYIADFLERKGYVRIQKSVFFGNVPRKTNLEVYGILKEINSTYKNGDSILFLPIGTDNITNLKLVGKNINFETMVNRPNTLFF